MTSPCNRFVFNIVPVAALWLLFSTFAFGQEPSDVKLPDAWKSPPKSAEGWRTYLCEIKLPESWLNRAVEFHLEGVDDAREVLANGKTIGTLGEFPPNYRSGLGQTGRFAVDPQLFTAADRVRLTIRTYAPASRTGFNVSPPAIFSGDEAISLAGKWQFIAGEKLPEKLTLPEVITKVVPAVELRQQLLRLPGDEGPLSPAETLAKFKTPDDLAVELVLAEPHITQPLSMKFDTRGRLWVMEYRQYPEPAGLKMVSRDKFLRTVYDRLPEPPPKHFPGADRISIHTDMDGDGKFDGANDKHEVFLEGLSLATSFAIDAKGVWVLQPPYLLFYPDENQDSRPDGDPVVHLEGFGIEDSHSLANSLRWGPDGWLYGAQGSTVTGNIRKPGAPDKEVVHSLGQLIWRYHPGRKKYEIFAEGGGNTFGIEIDSAGRIFSGHNGGNTRGFHYVQGGYYQKGFGKHGELSNPYAFGYFPAMTHHDAPRFTHTFIFNEADSLGEKYRDLMFAIAPMQGQVVLSERSPEGSTFKTKDVGFALESGDPWFRPVDIQLGPDGGVYISDFYEQRIDHASHYQGRIHRESGRIWRLKGKANTLPRIVNFQKLKDVELVELLIDSTNRSVHQLIAAESKQRGGLDEDAYKATFASRKQAPWGEWPNTNIRYAVDQIEHFSKSERIQAHQRLVEFATEEHEARVRSQIASSARRLPASDGISLLRPLLTFHDDSHDPHIPLLIWWAIEKHADDGWQEIQSQLLNVEKVVTSPVFVSHIAERLMKRYAITGRQEDLRKCAVILNSSKSDQVTKNMLAGFESAMNGRPNVELPKELIDALAKHGNLSPTLKLRQGDAAAIAEALKFIINEKADGSRRTQFISILGSLKKPAAVEPLLVVLSKTADDSTRFAALEALQNFPDDNIGSTLVAELPKWPVEMRDAALSVLASRQKWAEQLLAAVETKTIRVEDVPENVVRRLSLQGNEAWQARVQKLWPPSADSNPDELRAELDRLTSILSTGSGNPYDGKKLYAASCGKCHKLFDGGGKIGPDLTIFQRTDLRRMLINIVQPSVEIREGFETYLLQTADGRTLTGFITDQDAASITLRTPEGQTVTVQRDEVETLRATPISIMPAGQLKTLSEQQLRDLFAYLRSTQPLSE